MTRTAGKMAKAGRAESGTAKEGDLLTAGRLAEAWGVKPGEVKPAIAAAGVRPDVMRCGCAYYGRRTATTIKKHLAKG